MKKSELFERIIFAAGFIAAVFIMGVMAKLM